MRIASSPSGSVPARSSARTSQTACARKHASSIPANHCGRPNRSRVKYPVIEASRVFYHVASPCGKLPYILIHDDAHSSPHQRPTLLLHRRTTSLYPHTVPRPRRPAPRLGTALVPRAVPRAAAIPPRPRVRLNLPPHVVSIARQIHRLRHRNYPRARVTQNRAPPLANLRPPRETSLPAPVLERRTLGIRRPHRPRRRPRHRSRIRIRPHHPARPAPGKIRRLLGRHVPAGRLLRRIPLPRIHAVHARARNPLLALRPDLLLRLRRRAPLQSRRNSRRPRRSLRHRPLLLPHPAPHRLPVVRRRIPRRLGLGRNFLLFRPRQRLARPRPPT